jgi:hypothetical protein
MRILVLALLLGMSTGTHLNEQTLTHKARKYIIGLKQGLDSATVASEYSTKFHALQSTTNKIGFTYTIIPAFSATLTDDMVAALKADDRIEYVEPDRPVHMLNQPKIGGGVKASLLDA